MDVKIYSVTAFEQNCSLIICPVTRKAALVDPGGDIDALEALVSESGVSIEKLLITHGHVDHCGQAGILAKRLGVPIEGPHQDDDFWISQLDTRGATFGMTGTQPFVPDRWLNALMWCTAPATHPAMWSLSMQKIVWPLWVMFCLLGLLAARIFPEVTTPI
jgi:glyoxylase-like metal-dependent hydrolase (beta-lactamase superfamily II)